MSLYSTGCSVLGYFVFFSGDLSLGCSCFVSTSASDDRLERRLRNDTMATFDHTTQLPSHCYALPSKWVFKNLDF